MMHIKNRQRWYFLHKFKTEDISPYIYFATEITHWWCLIQYAIRRRYSVVSRHFRPKTFQRHQTGAQSVSRTLLHWYRNDIFATI